MSLNDLEFYFAVDILQESISDTSKRKSNIYYVAFHEFLSHWIIRNILTYRQAKYLFEYIVRNPSNINNYGYYSAIESSLYFIMQKFNFSLVARVMNSFDRIPDYLSVDASTLLEYTTKPTKKQIVDFINQSIKNTNDYCKNYNLKVMIYNQKLPLDVIRKLIKLKDSDLDLALIYSDNIKRISTKQLTVIYKRGNKDIKEELQPLIKERIKSELLK